MLLNKTGVAGIGIIEVMIAGFNQLLNKTFL